ncbi:MAG TPA: GNAT family N-acetyltransferase [Pyrinomonadaceae bacterium]|nr:GNAT family N-acetyltransferase [Pyrinomonadaceae bacterium]
MLPSSFDNIIIRAASNQDGERVTALVSNILAEFGLQVDLEETDSDLRDIERNYLKAGGVFEVIEDERGNLLGTVGLYPVDESTCELRKMYFVPEARGRGLGKYILERAITRAAELGFERIVLETASVLKAANHLYVKYGFRPLRKEHLPQRADLAYILDLNPS